MGMIRDQATISGATLAGGTPATMWIPIEPNTGTVTNKIAATELATYVVGTIASATTSVAGFMSAADKTKLNLITITGAASIDTLVSQSHAAVTATNASIALSGQAVSVAIDGGANNLLSLAGGGLRVDAAATSHTHAIADTTGLQTALDAKSATGHTHAATDIASGTIATARLGSGTASASTFLRGDQTWATVPAVIGIAVSDEQNDLTAGASKITFRMPHAFTLTDVRASVSVAPVGSTIIVDIKENGSSIFSTKISIDASEKTSTTAATPHVLSDSVLADDSEITVSIDQVGSSTPGMGLKLWLIGVKS